MILILFLTSIFIWTPTHAETVGKACDRWFNNSKLKPKTESCYIKCYTLSIDMGTWTCPEDCHMYCKDNEVESKTSKLIGKLVYYPGLTEDEKKLVEENPKDSLVVFIQKTKAESSSEENFPTQGLNDEGDAFRHYVWAGLLTKELGIEKAKKYLEAHEANPLQPFKEREMDMANNKSGISSAEKLIKSNEFTPKKLYQMGLDDLRSGKLSVLKSGLPIPKEPK